MEQLPPRNTSNSSDVLLPKDMGKRLSHASTAHETIEKMGSSPVPINLWHTRSEPGWADCRRTEAKELGPEALVQLHKLHEDFLKYSGPAVTPEDTSHATMDKQWGSWGQGSWQVHGKLPDGGTERPLHTRKLRLLPPGNGTDFDVLLQSRGMAYINTKGQKGASDRTLGQDNFSFSHLPNGWEVLCVMDGHGHNGDWPATRACKSMPFFLKGKSCTAMLNQGEVKAALMHAFRKVQTDLKIRAFSERVDLQVSGCTAVCVLWNTKGTAVWVATAGDSRAVLMVPEPNRVVAQTIDHKPTLEAERRRIEEAGGEVIQTEFEDGFVETRVNIKGQDYPGISMSRSLGDLCVKGYGVIADPEVVQWDLVQDGLVLAASDGVWEFLSTEQVCTMISESLRQGQSYKAALERVLAESRQAWKDHEGTYCDDITIALVSLNGCKAMRMSSIMDLSSSFRQGSCSACVEGLKKSASDCQVM